MGLPDTHWQITSFKPMFLKDFNTACQVPLEFHHTDTTGNSHLNLLLLSMSPELLVLQSLVYKPVLHLQIINAHYPETPLFIKNQT